MSKRKRRARTLKPAAALKIVKLKAPEGCGPLKRGGRRYVPSREGIVAVPAALVDDLIAHGFAPLAEDVANGAGQGEDDKTHGKNHGRG